uniref:Putative secreted protein n=1 Tax=Anopheles triannulatus TaxID=58253 RepID=A0A2M4B1W5_9DIPT
MLLLLLLWMLLLLLLLLRLLRVEIATDVGIADAAGRFDRSPVGLRINDHLLRVHAVRCVRGVQRVQYRPHVLIDLETFRKSRFIAHRTPPVTTLAVERQIRLQIEALNVLTVVTTRWQCYPL